MTKGKWFARALHVTIALSFILGALVVAPSVSADPGTSKWEKQGTPTDADLVILPGSDITDMATSADGETIYAIGLLYDTSHGDPAWTYVDANVDQNQEAKLWRSQDGGVTWKDRTAKVNAVLGTDEYFVFFSAVAVAPDDPDLVFISANLWTDVNDSQGLNTGDTVDSVIVGSDDAGDKWHLVGCAPLDGYEILCMDVSMEVDDDYHLIVGTAENDAALSYGSDGYFELNSVVPMVSGADDGRVFLYEFGSSWGSAWTDVTDTTVAAYDDWVPSYAVTSVAFSPNYDVDGAFAAVCVADVTGTTFDYIGYKVQMARWGNIDAWNADGSYGGYPVVIDDGDNVISAADGEAAKGTASSFASELLDFAPVLRLLTDISLPMDFFGDESSERNFMVSVNGQELEQTTAAVEDEGGFIFFVDNNDAGFELLDNENNPFVASIDYYGSIDMEGKALAGLLLPYGEATDQVLELEGWFFNGGYADVDEILGCCAGIQVLRSEAVDVCCPDWDEAQKPPSGQFAAIVGWVDSGDKAYAVTAGESWFQAHNDFYVDESAFSMSETDGDCWNQMGLIDTDIDFIADVAVNPACGYIYLLTGNVAQDNQVCECESVWRSEDNGSTYMRVWHGNLANDDGVLGLAPEEEDAVETIYLAETDNKYIFRAGDSGLCKWTKRNTPLGDTAPEWIQDMAVLDESTVYVMSLEGNVVKSTTGGRHWSSKEDVEVDDLAHTIVCLGDWVLVGGNAGSVSYSNDGGDSFSELDDVDEGYMAVAFDSYFDDNGYVYAASSHRDTNDIWRSTIDDASWESMDACPDLEYYGLMVSFPDGNPKTSASTGGVLYASYNSGGCTPESGVARILAPAASDCCGTQSWDFLWAKLADDVDFGNDSGANRFELSNLKLCGCLTADTDTTLWAIDIAQYYQSDYSFTDHKFAGSNNYGRLWKYNDCFSKAGPELIGVEDGATIPSDPCACVNEDFVLEWDRICDACEYDIQIALDEGFKHIVMSTSLWANSDHTDCNFATGDNMLIGACETAPMEFYKPSDPCVPSLVIAKTLDCGQQYWWRVRARVAETGEVYRSQWSDKWSFTVAVGPGGAIKLTAPDDGASNVPLENIVFTWTAVADATSYEMVLMDASGAEVASNSGDATSFVLGSKLDYDSAYMWQVNAMKGSNVISESGNSTFRTMSAATPPPEIPETVINFPEPVTGTPTWVWVVIALAAILIIVVIVLIFRTRRV